jgi:hypothetical protein
MEPVELEVGDWVEDAVTVAVGVGVSVGWTVDVRV